jgi:hypothetical protein
MTPEQLEAARLAEEEYQRQIEETRRRQRELYRDEFNSVYTTYTTRSYAFDFGSIDYDSFFDVPAPEPPPPTLQERYDMALREADRCARTGNPRGQLTAVQEARRLRTRMQLINQVPSITV